MIRLPALDKKTFAPLCAVLVIVCLAYANHFGNAFHFDDSHTITDNPYIRDLSNIPRFFTDADTFSALPTNRGWRPLVSTSLAVDYWLANGLDNVAWFHASTFFWYLIQLCLIYALLRKVLDRALPDPRNLWVATFATALYGLHPAMAETVNYVIQRGDVFSTLGVIAGLVIYAYWPTKRAQAWYLIPVALGLLAKPPGLVFPLILFAYIVLIEEVKPALALRRSVPAIALVAAYSLVAKAMTPTSFNPGAVSAANYRLTQPLVALRYFRTFFLPTNLTADTDHSAVSNLFQENAWIGFVFIIAVIVTAVRCGRKRELRPIAFGLYWYLLALLPTSIFPLAEIENDHRMFFPFVGLTLAMSWMAALWLYRHPLPRAVVATACGLVLTLAAYGTWQRNKVWHSEESLWYDVTLKSPRNGRGLMNYGLSQMAVGRYETALDYFTRALVFNPNYHVLDINLGVVNGELGNDEESERHFKRAIALAPTDAYARHFYSRWLRIKGRRQEAVEHLTTAIAANPTYLEAQHLLMTVLSEMHDSEALQRAARAALARFPSDSIAQSWLNNPVVAAPPTPESLLETSLALYKQGQFDDSITAARQALKMRPGYAEAWNNIAAAYNSMSRWDEGISACQEAIRLKPDFQLARNNLAWAVDEKQKSDVQR